jgi:hypothetical protein
MFRQAHDMLDLSGDNPGIFLNCVLGVDTCLYSQIVSKRFINHINGIDIYQLYRVTEWISIHKDNGHRLVVAHHSEQTADINTFYTNHVYSSLTLLLSIGSKKFPKLQD